MVRLRASCGRLPVKKLQIGIAQRQQAGASIKNFVRTQRQHILAKKGNTNVQVVFDADPV